MSDSLWVFLLTAEGRLMRHYDDHVCAQHAPALDVVEEYGELLDSHATGAM